MIAPAKNTRVDNVTLATNYFNSLSPQSQNRILELCKLLNEHPTMSERKKILAAIAKCLRESKG